MGSVDLPPFLRDKQKENIQKQKSGELPPFIKKKEEEGKSNVSLDGSPTTASQFGIEASKPLSPTLEGRMDKSFLDRDIDSKYDFSLSNPELFKPENKFSLRNIYNQQAQESFNLEKDANRFKVKENTESLKEYSNKRIGEINADIKEKKEIKSSKISYSEFQPQPTKEEQDEVIKLNEDIVDSELYKAKLKSSIVPEAAKMVIEKALTFPDGFNPTEVGREIISIADPDTEFLYTTAEKNGGVLPRIQRSYQERLGLDIAKNYLENKPDTPEKERLLGLIDLYEKDFDLINVELTAQRVRDKLGVYFYNKGKSGVLGYSSANIEDAINDPELGLSEVEKSTAKREIIPNEARLGIWGTNISGSGFLRSFKEGFGNTLISPVKSIGDLTGLRTEKDIAQDLLNSDIEGSSSRKPGESPILKQEYAQLVEKQNSNTITPEEKIKKTDIEKYLDVRSGWSKFVDGTGDLTGQVAAIALTTKGIGGAGRAFTLAGEGGGMANLLSNRAIVSRAIGSTLSNETVGLTITGFLNSYDSYRQQALQLMPGENNEANRKAYATTMGFIEGATERIFNDTKVLKAFSKEVAPSVRDITSRFINNEITQQVAREELQTALQKYLKPFGKEFVKSEFQESTEEGVVTLADGIAQSVFGGQSFDIAKTGQDAVKTFLTTALYSPVVSGLAAHGAAKRSISENAFMKSAIVDMARQPNEYLKAVEQLQLSGEINQQQANEKIKLINSANNYLKEVPTESIVTEKVGDEEKTVTKELDYPVVSSYLIHRLNEGILNEKAEATTDEVLKSQYEKEIKRSQEIRKGLLDGKIGVTPDMQDVTDNSKKANELGIDDSSNMSNDSLIGTPFSNKEKAKPKSLFESVQEIITTPFNETEDERLRAENAKTLTEEQLMPELKAQSIDAPTGVMNTLQGNRELTTDLIAQNSEEEIEAARKKWSKIDSETSDENVSLLEEGLAKKQGTPAADTQASSVLGRGDESLSEADYTAQQMAKPIAMDLLKLERDFNNNGYEISIDYDNEIQIVNKKTKQPIESEKELPQELRGRAEAFQEWTNNIDEMVGNPMAFVEKHRKEFEGEDAEFEVIQPKQLSQPSTPSQEGGGAKQVSADAPLVKEGGYKVKTKEASNEEPPLPKGETIVTLSGMTESERQNKIAERQGSTGLSESEKSENKLAELSYKADKLRSGNEKTNAQSNIRQEVRKLNAEVGSEKYKYNGVNVFKKTTIRKGGNKGREVWRKISAINKDVGNQSVKEGGKPLRDRSRELQENFDNLVSVAEHLEVSDANGRAMSKEQIDAAVQDIYDGIPSVQAENLLDVLEEGVRTDDFPIKDNFANEQVRLNDLLGTQSEILSEPLTEDAIKDWLNDESKLTPEQEDILNKEFENLLYEFPEIETEIPISETKTGTETTTTTKVEPKVADQQAAKKVIPKTEKEQTEFENKVDKFADDLIKLLTPKTTIGVKKQGLGIPEIVKAGAAAIKASYRVEQNIEKAIAKGIAEMKRLWKQSFGDVEFPEEQLREMMNKGFGENVPPKQTEKKEGKDDEPKKIRSVFKNIIERSKLTKEQKERLKADPSSLYTELPNETAKQIAFDLINEMGVEAAVAEASRKNSALEPVERVMVLGAAMNYYAGKAKEAAAKKNETGVTENSDLELDANEKMQEVARTLAGLGTDFGRAINIFNEVYKLSNLALERKLKKTVDELNKIRNPQANEDSKTVEAIIKDEKNVVSGIGEEMTEADLEKESDSKKKIDALEKEVADLRKQIKNVGDAKTGSKKNPLKITRVTNDTEYDKRLKEFNSRQRTGINKDDLNDLTYFGLYHLENGLTKFADWVKVMAKKFNGFREYLQGIYKNVRDEAIQKGADKNEFDTDVEIDAHLDDLQKQSDARKIANATKKLAAAKTKRDIENDPDKARVAAPRHAAERIRRDAEKNLDLPTTKNEQTYLKRLIKVVQDKAREYYKEKKETVKNVNDWLQFAIANGKTDYAIWERTQQEVESQIDADENLTDEQKEEVKDFLSEYQDSIFDTLLTTSQREEIIRQKLIDGGFGTEKTVNGKVVKAVDWNKIIGSAKNIKEAKAAIVKSITDLGYTQEEAANEINSILTDFDNKVADKKTRAINSYLNKGIINKAKNALGLTRKSKVQKLIDMNNKGILDDSRVKDVLAKDLGIISLTEADLAKVRELSEKIDKATVPFIKKKYEEQLQYLFDSKSGNLTYLENREFVMNNRLTSLWNQIQNLTGYFRILSTYIAISIKTGSPVQAAKVFRKQWKDGVSDALTVLMGGHVSRGTAFSDLTRSTEGEARVRYLEQGKGKLLGLPDLYLRIAGKTIQINPINVAYRKIKYVGRLMESADTIPSNVISGLTQYWQIKKQMELLNPELSSKEIEQKTYNTMYGISIDDAKSQAVKDLKESGVENPTKYEVNRASHEIVERNRNELIAKEFYDTVERLKPIAKEKLKQQGNENPTGEEITKEVYSIMGRDEPLDIVARGERQALRETGKKTTAGITALALLPIDGFQKKLKEQMLSKHGQAGKAAINVADAAFNQLLPFANSIGRWIEMGIELTPYGVLKGLGYKGYGAWTKRSGNQKLSPVELSELGDDYIIRGIQGTAQTLLIMYLMGILKGEGGDDDDEDKITGQYQGTDFPKQKIKQVGNPKRSLDIGGRKFPLDLIGNASYPLMMYSDFLDRRTDENERHGVLYTTAAMYMNTAAESAYGRLGQYGSIVSAVQSGKEDRYLPKLGTIAGQYLGAQAIPFNRFQQEIGELWNPKSNQSITFGENLLQQLSIVGGFRKEHPAFDYRGRGYDKGDIWVGSPDGIRKMFTKSKSADAIDSELAKIDFGATDAFRETKDEENYKYTIVNEDGTRRFMTPEEYYKFRREAGSQFNDKLVNNFEVIKNLTIVNTEGNVDEQETAKAKREAYSDLLTKSKENALAVIQAATGHLANVEELKKEKKEENKFILKQKKSQLQGVDNQ